jgi:molybdopterin synthase catalytic subunit
MPARLTDSIFDPWQLLQQFQQENLQPGRFGATASFVGTMRDFNIGESITSMKLEHYPAMTQHFLDRLCTQSIEKFELEECLIIHRYGDILPGQPIVLIVAWSAHRANAFDACRQVMEELKSNAPFWKKEITKQGERWVHDDLDM